ncbi:MAG: hypothetical protein M1822_007334 [Bathelium mastoideum]|nr:MAG: hypothetical protein M1822_007334 [Bathelium mastoideum]
MGSAASSVYTHFTQFYPPKPTITGSNLANQKGKVFIITGGNSGFGFELAKILYAAEGTVYILTRDEVKSTKAIAEIEAAQGATPGKIQYLHLDLADLSSVSEAAAAFLAAESRLDVLFNLAGIASAPLAYKTKQGLEPHFGVNCVAPFLLTRLLLPVLTSTAKIAGPHQVRVVWTSSILVEMMAPKGGVTISELDNPSNNRDEHYSASKAGNWFLASEFHRRFGHTGVLHVTQNPGSLRTNVWRTTPVHKYWPFYFMLSQAVYGAYTNLWAAFSEDITSSDGGRYIIPWGRWHPGQREDIVMGLKSKTKGGTGQATEFWDWCETQAKPFFGSGLHT